MEIKIYSFKTPDEETFFAFRLSGEQHNGLYTPYITNSVDAITHFTDHLEFAETIQDKGAKYVIAGTAILFEDEASAQIGAETFLEIVSNNPKKDDILYAFARKNHYGQRPKLSAILEERYPEGYSETEREALYLELEEQACTTA